MGAARLRPWCCFVACLIAVIALVSRSGVAAGPDFSKMTCDALVDVLRDRERLVRTASCTLVVTETPTAAVAIPRLRAISQERGDDWGGRDFIISAESARRSSKTVRWCGAGQMERFERYATPADARKGMAGADEIRAFDGEFVRCLSKRGKELVGGVLDPDKVHWHQSAQVGGFSLIYKYRTTYLSGLLQRSKMRSSPLATRTACET